MISFLLLSLAVVAAGFALLARTDRNRASLARPFGFVLLGIGVALVAATLAVPLTSRLR